MRQVEIDRALNYFTKFSDSPYYQYGYDPMPAKWYMHNEQEFHLIVFPDNTVYQGGSEADLIGVELETYVDLYTRFLSFTGTPLEAIEEYHPMFEFTMTNRGGSITKSLIPCDGWVQATAIRDILMKRKSIIGIAVEYIPPA